jgi:hypothetical protein
MEGQALTARSLAPFSPAFLAGDARCSAFLSPDFRSAAERRQSVLRAAQRGIGPALAAAPRALEISRP